MVARTDRVSLVVVVRGAKVELVSIKLKKLYSFVLLARHVKTVYIIHVFLMGKLCVGRS